MTPRWFHREPGSHHPAWVVLPRPPLRLDDSIGTLWHDATARRLWITVGSQVVGLSAGLPSGVRRAGAGLQVELADHTTAHTDGQHLRLSPAGGRPPALHLPLGAARSNNLTRCGAWVAWSDRGWVYRASGRGGALHPANTTALGLLPPGARLHLGSDGAVLAVGDALGAVAAPSASLQAVAGALPEARSWRVVMVPGGALLVGPSGRYRVNATARTSTFEPTHGEPWHLVEDALCQATPAGLLRVSLTTGEQTVDTTIKGPALATPEGVVRIAKDALFWPDGLRVAAPAAHRCWYARAGTIGLDDRYGDRWRFTRLGGVRDPGLVPPPPLGTPASAAWARLGLRRDVGEGLGGRWLLARFGGLVWVPNA